MVVGVDVPGVRCPPDPEGLASRDAGRESPAGPTWNVGPCLGSGWTTPGTSDENCGRPVLSPGLGEPKAAATWGERSTVESIEVGGGSCGGETCGVIMAGSVGAFR
jgi:hypothetical protein